MKHRIGSLLIGAGALALATLGVPAVTAVAVASASSSHASSSSASSSSAATFTLTPSGTDVKIVGTTHWQNTAPAGPATSVTGGGPHPITAATAAISRSRVPDVGVERTTETLAVAPGAARGTLGERHAVTGHLVNVAGTAVTGPTAGLSSVSGITAYDQGLLHPVYVGGQAQPLPGIDVEPPDQGLCAGGGKILELNNMVAQVFTQTSMKPLGGNGMALEKLFAAPEVFGGAGTGGVNVQGDPRCYYTPSSNRWFASQLWLTEVGASTTFTWAGEFVAVSATSTPMGTWNVFFIPDQFNAKRVDLCNSDSFTTLVTGGPANPCFGDQPLLGVSGNAVFISVNEYGLYKATSPGGVATEYALSKSDLLAGIASPIYWNHLGDTVQRPTTSACPFKPPATASPTGTALHCPYYSIVPANSDGAYVTSTTGTFYSLSNVTFTTTGGHQIAVWQFTNTDAVTTGGAQITGAMTIVTTGSYTEPPFATQKAGPVPLGTYFEKIADQRAARATLPAPFAHPRPLPEGALATNTDRVATAAYDPATGAVWGALNTGLATNHSAAAGVFWVDATPTGSGSSLTAATVGSGYIAANSADIQFPAVTFTNGGAGVMGFSLSGQGYYPSTAYSMVGSNGPAGIHMANAGVGPEDGFSEYTPSYHRPRWGDYSTALATGTTFFFATEKIDQSCSPGQFAATFTCGGTRDATANWGTSVSKLLST